MSMKLSRRDRVIILVAIVIIIAIAGYLVLLKPKYEEMIASNDRLAAKEAERADVEAKIGTLEDLKKQLKKNVDDIVDDQTEFISEKDIFQTQQISTYLMDMLDASGINIKKMSVPALEPGSLAAYTYNKDALAYEMRVNADIAHELPEEVYYAYNDNYPAPPQDVIIGLSTVDLEFRFDENGQILDAIQVLADSEKNIYLNNVGSSVAEGEDGEEPHFEGTMTISFYTINPLDPDDVDKSTVTLTDANTDAETAPAE